MSIQHHPPPPLIMHRGELASDILLKISDYHQNCLLSIYVLELIHIKTFWEIKTTSTSKKYNMNLKKKCQNPCSFMLVLSFSMLNAIKYWVSGIWYWQLSCVNYTVILSLSFCPLCLLFTSSWKYLQVVIFRLEKRKKEQKQKCMEHYTYSRNTTEKEAWWNTIIISS